MVIGYHLIWTIYGYWFPNDPRGSTSRWIANDLLSELNKLHFGRKKIQPAGTEIREFKGLAEPRLKHPVIEFRERAIATVADAFVQTTRECRYTCYACAILKDHVHILIRKHRHVAEEMIANLQRESHLLLRERGFIDLQHPVWGGHGWKVFLDHPREIVRTIAYIDRNYEHARFARPSFAFVKPYDNWPVFEGHNPNSPWARAIREHGLRERNP